MSLKVILEDWSAYDAYKQKKGRNITDFLVEDEWEVSYLTGKIISAYPDYQDRVEIGHAINTCGRKISIPRHRRLLVQCVMKELGLA